jgi:hypothetical protein
LKLPPVPPGLDFRLEAFLEAIRSELLDIDKQLVKQDAEGDAGGSTTEGLLAFEPADESPVVLAGTGETISTEDAWTTISSGAPDNARYAIIQFYMYSNDDDAGGKITRRTASGSPEIEAVIIRADGTSDADRAALAIHLVPLNEGSFDYKADTTAGDARWQIRRIGYVM